MKLLRKIAKNFLFTLGLYDKYLRLREFFYGKPQSQRVRDYNGGSASFWTKHMVVSKDFTSAEESLQYFQWRNDQYPGYIDLMPVSGQDGKVVLDYGCGPGNDLVGFAVYSLPSKLIGADVSTTALTAARRRLSLHNEILEQNLEFILIDEVENKIPLDDNSVDYIHSSGVLHHCTNLALALRELRRVLKVGGKMSIMVYNRDSIFSNLYVPWYRQIYQRIDKNLTFAEAFRRSTDTSKDYEAVPVSYCYRPDEFINLVEAVGFKGDFKGAAISSSELDLTKDYLRKAVADKRLGEEYREFLAALKFNKNGIPLYHGHVAGIDACYLFEKLN